MENKKSFGAYILKRRKELGMTQKEFAEKLFVTDSAVSKWERGLAYPDITLLQSICQILEISEKELLSSAEDVEGRRAEQLARKYLRLTRNYRLVQVILYGIIALGCLIGNLAAQHTLSWFWIVLMAEGMGASLTLVPALVEEKKRGIACLGSFTGFLLLLLAVCCLYTGGNWFFVAATGTLFGMGLVFLPYVMRRLPLPEQIASRKGSVYIGAETALLLLLLGAGCIYDGGKWFFVAAASVLFGVGLVFGPMILRQFPLRGRRTLVYVAVETALLVLLLGVSCIYEGGSWFASAAVWSVFGMAVVFLPFVIRQIPWPEPFQQHKALLYFGILSIYLILGLMMEGWGDWFPMPGLPISLICLVLPWIWLGAIRYLPINGWFRAAVGFLGTGLWAYLAPWGVDRVLMASGWISDQPFSLLIQFNFSEWQDYSIGTGNVLVLIYLGFGILALGCIAIGLWRRKRKS